MDQNISKSLYKDFCGTVDFHEEGGESAVEIENDIVISSEDEELESSLQPPKAVAWTSTKDMSLVRTSDSVLKYAKMRPGPNGFAIGQFSGSETEHPSEIQDSMLELHKKYDPEKIEAKKPAAKKAAAKMQPRWPVLLRDLLHLQNGLQIEMGAILNMESCSTKQEMLLRWERDKAANCSLC